MAEPVESQVPPIPPPNNVKSTLTKFFRGLFFLPYDTNLLAPNAIYWLLAMWIVAGLMAASEGVAVYEIGSTFSDGRIYVASLMAIGWAGIIWMVDVTFITYDLSQLKHEKPGRRILSDPLIRTIVIRGVIILLSVVVTMPFLGELVQREELIKKIDTHNMNAIAKLKQTESERIRMQYDIPINVAREEKRLLEENYTKESIGQKYREKGSHKDVGTGIPGSEGPAARSLEKRIEIKKQDIEKFENSRDSELDATLARISDNETTREGWERLRLYFPESETFRLLTSSPADMARARELYLSEGGVKILGMPGEQVIASAALTVVFLIMVALKCLEPQSIKIYFDARLQENYKRYLGGAFNKELPRDDHPASPTPMESHAFHEWFYQIHEPGRLSDKQKSEIANKRKLKSEKMEVLSRYNVQLASLKDEMGKIKTGYNEQISEVGEALKSAHKTQEGMKNRLGKLEKYSHKLMEAIQAKANALSTYRAGVKGVLAPGEDPILESMQDDLDGLQSELKLNAGKYSDQQTALTNLDERITFSSTKLDGLNANFNECLDQETKRHKDIQHKINALDAEVENIEKEIAELERKQIFVVRAEQPKPFSTESAANLGNGKMNSPVEEEFARC